MLEKSPQVADASLERPPKLYHGSTDGSITQFEPRTHRARPEEGAKTYASPTIETALQSMANRFVSNGGVVNGRRFVCIPYTEEEFKRLDTGGYLYELPVDSFFPNHGYGLEDDEWVSSVPVTPLQVTHYPSLYQTLKDIGAEIYYINPEQSAYLDTLQVTDDGSNLEAFLAQLTEEGRRD